MDEPKWQDMGEGGIGRGGLDHGGCGDVVFHQTRECIKYLLCQVVLAAVGLVEIGGVMSHHCLKRMRSSGGGCQWRRVAGVVRVANVKGEWRKGVKRRLWPVYLYYHHISDIPECIYPSHRSERLCVPGLGPA